MEFYFTLFTKLIALASLGLLGFIARRYVKVERESIAKLVFYILVPITFFHAIANLKPEPEGALKIQLRQIHAFSIFYWR
jgi:predicted permease